METTTRKVSVKLTMFAGAVEKLIEADKLDRQAMLNAVNAALGELDHAKTSTAKLDGKIKATKDAGEQFKLTEKLVNQFSATVSAPLRFYVLSQDIGALEERVGQITLAEWPTWLRTWAIKFAMDKKPSEPVNA